METEIKSRVKSRGILTAIFVLGTAVSAMLASNFPSPMATATSTPHIFEWRPFLAPFHSVLLHYPIGFVTMAFILEIYALFRPSAELRKITRLVMVLSIASAFVVAALGIMRASSKDYDPHTLSLHRAFGIAVPACITICLAVQALAIRKESHRILMVYRGLLLGTLGLLVAAGHQGGNLTHGAKYLVENAPGFMKTLLSEEQTAEPQAGKGSGASEGVFAAKIRPLLEARCVQCHGAVKHKGGYRLDLPEQALKGGESGRVAIKPGDPFESNLVRLILLPRTSDDVMPPEGKDPLTAEETMLLIRWIQAGAPFGGTNLTAMEIVKKGP